MNLDMEKVLSLSLTKTDLVHCGIRLEELPVLRVLQVVLLDVGPQLLDALGTRCLLLAHNRGQLGAELHGAG